MKHLMTQSFSMILLVVLVSCSTQPKDQTAKEEDNPIIKEMYDKDIAIRELDAKTDTVNLEEYDKGHREKIFQLLSDNKVITPKDKIRAAWILQHTVAKTCDGELTSLSPENFLLAYQLSSNALIKLEQKNDTAAIRATSLKRIIALNYDRYLLFTFGYQKFGTQFVFDDKTGEMLLAPIDTTLTNDEERKKHNVEPLRILLENHKMKPIHQRK